jgi:ArsR family transcriptional regulator, arsenate/arsenite/antimonite-responsive transcriptional repressor
MPLMKSLKALADEKRLKILQMLIANDLCVGALSKHLGVTKPAVSQHLRILRKAGLVTGEKRGYWTHYTVNRHAIRQIAVELNDLASQQKSRETVCWRIHAIDNIKPQLKEIDMCENCCQQPGKLMDKPENCTPEQIKECHGDTKEHPCAKDNGSPENH